MKKAKLTKAERIEREAQEDAIRLTYDKACKAADRLIDTSAMVLAHIEALQAREDALKALRNQ